MAGLKKQTLQQQLAADIEAAEWTQNGSPRGCKSTFDVVDAVKRVADGETMSSVARSYGLTPCAVAYHVRKFEHASGSRLARRSWTPQAAQADRVLEAA